MGALPIISFSIATYRRSRWTLSKIPSRRYVPTSSKVASRNIVTHISALADLALRFFAEQDNGRPYHHLPQPPRSTEKGKRSLLQFAQRRPATAPSRLLGHFPHLFVTGRKTEHTQAAHTVQARTHWDGSCRLKRTAAAPRSCFDTCAYLRLTRVRAQQQASIYVTREHSPLFDYPCRIDYVVVGWSCWTLSHQPTDYVRFAARTCASLFRTRGPATRRHTWTRARYLWLRVCICGKRRGSQNQLDEIASEGVVYPYNFVVGFAIGVCTCATLY